eukprot:403361723
MHQVFSNLQRILIVEKEATAGQQGLYKTIQKAVDDAEPGSIIKIQPGLYEESVIVEKPGLVFEVGDKPGDITMQQQIKPCFYINLNPDENCTINGIRMLLKGPNKDEDITCGIFKEIHRKVPSIAVLPKNTLDIKNCSFKGDTTNDAYTTGILLLKSDANIFQCQFAHHKSGSIICDINPQNRVFIIDNQIVSSETAGIYVQGKASRPTIKGNKIRFCRSSAIITYLDVDGWILGNEMSINDVGIEILNNKSKVIENIIEKSHELGMKIVGDDNNTRCMPNIWKNRIFSCGQHGILCQGQYCEPDIRGNIIESNRKAGIKLTDDAIAHIGGTTKEEVKILPSYNSPLLVTQVNMNVTMNRDGTAGGPENTQMRSINKKFIGTVNKEYNPYVPSINLKSFPNSNIISQNYNQGILIVEGSSAQIFANKLEKNIKANIALGGRNSGVTKIKFNIIENSKSEGIFVVEGEEKLMIEENDVISNHDGIVLVQSKGVIKGNRIKENQRSGILTASNTRALIESNFIEENWTAGILIKEPSLPEIRKNEISKNYYQVQMEKHAKKLWSQYQKENPKIIGNNEIPKSTCSIF